MAIATRASVSDAQSAVLADLLAALGGDEAAARRYARAWQALVRDLLAGCAGAPSAAANVLDHLALTAPFAPGGPLRALMSAAGGIIPAMTGSVPATAPLQLPDTLDYQRFCRTVLQELSGAGTGLEHLMAAWQLSVADVARLFGVARQAVQQWLSGGVPAARQPKLATVQRIADLLERNLQPDRIPAVVRTPADEYGGRSMLRAIGDDDHDELLASVERSFDWSATA